MSGLRLLGKFPIWLQNLLPEWFINFVIRATYKWCRKFHEKYVQFEDATLSTVCQKCYNTWETQDIYGFMVDVRKK